MKTRPFTTPRTAIPLLIGIAIAVVTSMATPAAAAPTPNDPPQATAQTLQNQIDTQLRMHPGGTQISSNEIAWQNGNVVMTVGTLAFGACDSGWYCLYEHPNFNNALVHRGGRKLRFQQCGFWQFLSDYGFDNRASSWDNRMSKTVQVDDDDRAVRLWNSAPRSRSADVGTANDRADSLRILC